MAVLFEAQIDNYGLCWQLLRHDVCIRCAPLSSVIGEEVSVCASVQAQVSQPNQHTFQCLLTLVIMASVRIVCHCYPPNPPPPLIAFCFNALFVFLVLLWTLSSSASPSLCSIRYSSIHFKVFDCLDFNLQQITCLFRFDIKQTCSIVGGWLR